MKFSTIFIALVTILVLSVGTATADEDGHVDHDLEHYMEEQHHHWADEEAIRSIEHPSNDASEEKEESMRRSKELDDVHMVNAFIDDLHHHEDYFLGEGQQRLQEALRPKGGLRIMGRQL
uniref:RxLR effector protein n=1 Tax=Odontella aurita TaxID=265563 RepID=A0A7S4JX08_9STRA|mmetsp:Transcript_55554/g.166519  ORF Transcript_55554/g.166519 Transcript_55554/m.166519 type:complete len:120 (+) Transcript_55554:105-464(+)